MNDMQALLPYLKLRFNIDHPSYEDSYVFGYECGCNLLKEEENPFPLDSEAHEHWLEGWWAGVYGEEPLFKLAQEEEAVIAANDKAYHFDYKHLIVNFLKITGALTATAALGYQIFDLVA